MAEQKPADASQDPQDKPADPPAPPQEQPRETDAQAASRAFAESQAQADKLNLDEVQPGGDYVVNGVHVDANGKPIKAKQGATS